jgi:hypothetical protein
MQENLLSPTNINLFGRVFPLQVDRANLPAALGANHFLRNQLAENGENVANQAQFARIYAISYEGTFYNLPKPAIYLVHGPGRAVRGAGKRRHPGAAAVVEADNQPTVDDTGVIAEDFDLESDVRLWEYDKGDFTLRIDIASGTFDDILLEATLSVTARDALVSRSDLTSRSDLASRSDLTSRSDVTSRSDLTARHRLKG